MSFVFAGAGREGGGWGTEWEGGGGREEWGGGWERGGGREGGGYMREGRGGEWRGAHKARFVFGKRLGCS